MKSHVSFKEDSIKPRSRQRAKKYSRAGGSQASSLLDDHESYGECFQMVINLTKPDPFTLDEESLKRYNEKLRKHLLGLRCELAQYQDDAHRSAKKKKSYNHANTRARIYEQEIRA